MRLLDDLSGISSVAPDGLLSLNNYSAICQTYSCYKKLMSIALLPFLDLPSLQGFATKNINENILDYLRKWMRMQRMERLTLRFDSLNPEDNKRLTTSNPTLEDLSQMRSLLNDSIVAIIMGENNRFRQGYSVLVSFDRQSFIYEIVGPGFDATDLTRGQTVPHERFIIHRKQQNDDTYKDLSLIDILEHSTISQEGYLSSLEDRYCKIYGILQKGLGYAVKTTKISNVQKREVERFLLKQHAYALFRQYYIPIGLHRLQEFHQYISKLDQFYYNIVEKKVIAGSFLKSGLVFWDIFGSDKYLV